MTFEGQLALVTGGTRGIGESVVRELVESGASVIFTGRDKEAPSHILDDSVTEYEPVDFSDVEATQAFADRMKERPISLLVNNAGTNTIAALPEIRFEDWDELHNVNLRAPFTLCRALIPGMAQRGYGRIVNISSIFGHVTRRGRAAYTATKTALVGLTRTLAVEYASHNVLVNAVGPGFVDTELTRRTLTPEQRQEAASSVPLGRLADPSEIARIVAFLGSEANTLITGQDVIADGGFTIV